MNLYLVELTPHEGLVGRWIVLANNPKEALSVFHAEQWVSIKAELICHKYTAIDATTQSPLFVS